MRKVGVFVGYTKKGTGGSPDVVPKEGFRTAPHRRPQGFKRKIFIGYTSATF